jgi:hypothetical protein
MFKGSIPSGPIRSRATPRQRTSRGGFQTDGHHLNLNSFGDQLVMTPAFMVSALVLLGCPRAAASLPLVGDVTAYACAEIPAARGQVAEVGTAHTLRDVAEVASANVTVDGRQFS